MAADIGVGMIGASPERGWAKLSHVPAVQSLAGLRLAAVLGSTRSSAEASARTFGATRAYAEPADLFGDPAVDLVTVAVRVPAHRELILGALAAGKHVYCEWPLGRDLAEAEELTLAARDAGRTAVIGLQARRSPALRHAGDLVRSGVLGRVLSARIISETIAFGPTIPAAETYLEEPRNGATLVTIHAGHALDAASAVLGPLLDVQALTRRQFERVAVVGGMDPIARSTPDLILTQSSLEGGGALSVEIAGGRTRDALFRFEVIGDGGTLVLEGAAPRGFQSSRLRLALNGLSEPTDEGELTDLPDEAVNVGGVYAALRESIRTGSTATVGFDHAVRLTRFLRDLEASAKDGQRRLARGWPEHVAGSAG
ncbi:Gfo/Idh/MocA family protein [Methylobacterium planeticum]|uniref:Gfo/Idh/MocA family protein n=1 Tax=Methylobacterium planeticum TaxID=2615211 RepID=UPI00177EFE56|nr:Gfo/Idh/MocA family oxidoreductase [Methylobacterium planeticum]